MAYNPKQRPSLLEWAGSDAGNTGNANKRKDPVEEDGESTNPPMAKRRLDELGQ